MPPFTPKLPSTYTGAKPSSDVTNQWSNKTRAFDRSALRTNSVTGGRTDSKVAGRVFPSSARTSTGQTAASPKIAAPRHSTRLAADAPPPSTSKPPRTTPRTNARAQSNTPRRQTPRQTKRTLPSVLPRAAARPI